MKYSRNLGDKSVYHPLYISSLVWPPSALGVFLYAFFNNQTVSASPHLEFRGSSLKISVPYQVGEFEVGHFYLVA